MFDIVRSVYLKVKRNSLGTYTVKQCHVDTARLHPNASGFTLGSE